MHRTFLLVVLTLVACSPDGAAHGPATGMMSTDDLPPAGSVGAARAALTEPTCGDRVCGPYESYATCAADCPVSGVVRITPPGHAYGHHGWCDGWNGCGSAAGCAQMACEAAGYAMMVDFGDSAPCTDFDMCHLFWGDTGWGSSCNGVQQDWGNWCDVMGVTDIDCTNGSTTFECVDNSVCGDWNVTGAEVCDDGPYNGSPGACNAECSGPTPDVCGDWYPTGNEVCDDGPNNGSPGACNADCTGYTDDGDDDDDLSEVSCREGACLGLDERCIHGVPTFDSGCGEPDPVQCMDGNGCAANQMCHGGHCYAAAPQADCGTISADAYYMCDGVAIGLDDAFPPSLPVGAVCTLKIRPERVMGPHAVALWQVCGPASSDRTFNAAGVATNVIGVATHRTDDGFTSFTFTVGATCGYHAAWANPYYVNHESDSNMVVNHDPAVCLRATYVCDKDLDCCSESCVQNGELKTCQGPQAPL